MKPDGYKLSKEVIDPKTNEPPKITTAAQFLVWKFLKAPRDINWPRELKIANQLLFVFGNIEFWNFVDEDFKMNSLCWFVTQKGGEFLQREYKRFVFIQEQELVEKPIVKLEDNKLGEDLELQEKPKTLFDFIKRKEYGTKDT